MTDAHAAAKRVTAFLDRRAAFKGVEPEFLLALDGNRYVLRVSDLRALVSALPAERSTKPFMWRLRDGRMFHVGCGKEVLLIDGVELLCECGRSNR